VYPRCSVTVALEPATSVCFGNNPISPRMVVAVSLRLQTLRPTFSSRRNHPKWASNPGSYLFLRCLLPCVLAFDSKKMASAPIFDLLFSSIGLEIGTLAISFSPPGRSTLVVYRRAVSAPVEFPQRGFLYVESQHFHSPPASHDVMLRNPWVFFVFYFPRRARRLPPILTIARLRVFCRDTSPELRAKRLKAQNLTVDVEQSPSNPPSHL